MCCGANDDMRDKKMRQKTQYNMNPVAATHIQQMSQSSTVKKAELAQPLNHTNTPKKTEDPIVELNIKTARLLNSEVDTDTPAIGTEGYFSPFAAPAAHPSMFDWASGDMVDMDTPKKTIQVIKEGTHEPSDKDSDEDSYEMFTDSDNGDHEWRRETVDVAALPSDVTTTDTITDLAAMRAKIR
eukprot:352409_1